MRRLALLLPLVLAASLFAQAPATSPAAPPAIDPAKRAAIDELLSLMKVEQLLSQTTAQYRRLMSEAVEKAVPAEMQNSSDRAQVVADIKDFDDRVFKLMADRMEFSKIKPEYVRLYDETFTTEEIAGIVAFYKTPAGQAYVAKLPVLTTKTVEFMQRMLTAVMPDIQDLSAAWVADMKVKYSKPAK